MQKISNFFYNIKQGLINIKRHSMFSLASIGTMTACIFLFGIFYFMLANLRFMIKNAETQVGVSVFFDEGITDEEIEKIGSEIKERPEVAYVTFISDDEAWERYKQTRLNAEKDDSLIESFGNDNPLKGSASYEVHLSDVSMQPVLVRYIESLDGVRQVNDLAEVANALTSVNRIVSLVSTVIIGILVLVAVFLISTTISTGITVRRTEISIMKLIGATDTFIQAPFLVEGFVLGAAGALIPIVFLYFSYAKVMNYLTVNYGSSLGTSISLLTTHTVFVKLIPLCFLIGIGIGLAGSYLTLRRQLKKIN